MKQGKVGLVMTTGYAIDRDYVIRRAAADLAIPLVLNHVLAAELSSAISALSRGLIRLEVKEMSYYWRLGASIVSF